MGSNVKIKKNEGLERRLICIVTLNIGKMLSTFVNVGFGLVLLNLFL